MAIGALAHKLILDTTNFNEGATLSRKELSFLKSALRETATDAEKFGAGQEQIAILLKKGAISTEQAERAMEKLKEETKQTTPELMSLKEELTTSGIGAGAAAGIATVTAALVAAGAAAAILAENVKESLEQIDKLIAQSQNLDIPTDQFQAIERAASFVNIETAAIGKSMEKMLSVISKGDESKKFIHLFEMMGESAETLQKMNADEAFASILDSIQGIGNQADRVRLATQIFGTPDVLRMSAQAISQAADRMQVFGGAITSIDAEKFSELDDVMDQLGGDISDISTRFALEMMPAIQHVVSSADDLLVQFAEDGTLARGMQTVTDFVDGFVVSMKAATLAVQAFEPPQWMKDEITGISRQFGVTQFFEGMGAVGQLERSLDTLSRVQNTAKSAREKNERLRTGTPTVPFVFEGPESSVDELKAIEKNTRELKIQFNEVDMN